MKLIKSYPRLGMGPLLMGLVLLVTLGGCLDIRIKSNLGDCPTVTDGANNGGTDVVPGACRKNNWHGQDAVGFTIMGTNSPQVINTTGTHFCNASGTQKKCKTPAGKCGLGSNAPKCFSQFSPTGGNKGDCDCAC